MNGMIAFCGINCDGCKALIATKKDDMKMKREIVEEWGKEFGMQLKAEDVNCVGCLVADGPHMNYCSTCEIRKCGTEKKVDNCAYCVEYKCEKLAKFHEQAPMAKGRLEEIRGKAKKAHV